jgi:hypothetical protein
MPPERSYVSFHQLRTSVAYALGGFVPTTDPCTAANDVHFVLNYLVITAGHPTIRGTGFMEYLGTDGYSGLIFAARITLPHFSVSSAIS